MQIERTQLDTAVRRGIIDDAQATGLWSLLLAEQKDKPQFSFNHLLYYLGGTVAIGGDPMFVTLGWETLGGIGLFLVALAVMIVAACLTHHFLVEQKLAIPAGLMAALVVAVAPLAVSSALSGIGPRTRHIAAITPSLTGDGSLWNLARSASARSCSGAGAYCSR
jgi:hypothetical protein